MRSTYEKMEQMYRPQAHFYDLSRRYYLLGRDQLLNQLPINSNQNVLEIGCGTGRNLAILAKRFPTTNFYGIDASRAMLKQASKKFKKASTSNIHFSHCLAGEFSFKRTFELDHKFDLAFFSFSITMMPEWKPPLDNALQNLKSGGSLFFVDFYDQRNFPRFFRKAITGWLKQFHCSYPPDFEKHMKGLATKKIGTFNIAPIFRSYSFIAEFKKN